MKTGLERTGHVFCRGYAACGKPSPIVLFTWRASADEFVNARQQSQRGDNPFITDLMPHLLGPERCVFAG